MSTSSTDPGDRSASEIEREVDRERARVAGTIDALQDKVSVNGMIDQVVRAVTEHGGDVSRNLGRTMRDNPLPVILTSVGLAWLMTSSSSSGADRYRYDPYDDDWDRDYVDRAGLSSYPATDYPAADYDDGVADTTFGATSTPYAGGIDDDPAGTGTAYGEKDGPSVGDRFKDASAAAKGRASAMADSGRDRVGRARDGLHSSADRARQGLSSASDRAREGLHSASDRARAAAYDARYRARRGGQAAQANFEHMLEEQPLVLGALALALGAAFGSALPRTRTEDDMMGEQSDRVKDQLSTAARENAEKAKAVGLAVADEALNMADEAAGEVDSKTPSGSKMADNTKAAAASAAERLKNRADEEAERQGLKGGKTTNT